MSNRVTRRNNREHINIITHETYIEIDNGLFLDTTNYNFIEDLPGLDGATVDVNVVHNDFIIRSDIEESIRSPRPNRFHNMSEEETINYFDRMSQEE